MKQLCYYILAVALIFAVCYLIVDSRQAPAAPPAETAGATDLPGSPGPDGPASGSDLYIPEPLSEDAQAALDALYGELRTQDCLCAVAYLGAVPAGTPLAEYLERSGTLTELAEQGGAYRFLPELTPAQCGSGGFTMLYCLVPLSEQAPVCIRAGDRELYRSETGGPVLFTADSNGFQVSIKAPEGEPRELSVMPGSDGRPAAQPGLLDFTK